MWQNSLFIAQLAYNYSGSTYICSRSIQSDLLSRDFDFFRHQKEEGFRDSLPSMELLGAWLLQQLSWAAGGGGGRQLDNGNCTLDNNIPQSAQLWNLFLQISLWGNK